MDFQIFTLKNTMMLSLAILLAGCQPAAQAPQATAAPGSTEIPQASTPVTTLAGPTQTIAPTQTIDASLAKPTDAPFPTQPPAPSEGNMKISTAAFADGQPIPARYTCSGQNISPALNFEGIPGTAKSLALIADDPDAPAGTWVHWVVYNLPASLPGLIENIPAGPDVSGTGTQGSTSFGRPGYGGPCPPAGKPHRYYFKLYALDLLPAIPAGLDKAGLLKQMEGHILAQAQWMGTFQR